MLTVEQAWQEVRARSVPLPSRRRPLAEALGCALAEEVRADRDLPPFAKALVDGYAVWSADLAGPGAARRRLRLGEEIPAGRTPSRPLAPGEAALVMTGAPLPAGADAVVMIERARRLEPGQVELELDEAGPVAPGQGWMPRGREMRAGEILLRPGERLNPARLGLLASVGVTEVRVVPRPRLAVLPTGDELVEPDGEPGPGQIRNSNATMLRALALAAGGEAEALPIAPDEPGRLLEAVRRGLAADVLLITGGVSAGTCDLVPGVLDELGVARVFHKVRVKAGKPLWFGLGPDRAEAGGGERSRPLVFGLPGNPVSGLVGFLLFVRPALEMLAGRAGTGPVLESGRLARPFRHRGDRPTYHPARRLDRAGGGPVGEPPAIEPLEWAGSADLRTVASADGFAAFPAGDRDYDAGAPVPFLPMD